MTTTSPGWYDDGHGSIRWWDGESWTEHVSTPDMAPLAEQPTAVTVPVPPVEQPTAVTVPVPPVEQPTAVTVPVPPVEQPTAVIPPPYGGVQAPVAPPARQGSKLWIVWVVLGVIVLGVVATLAVVTPLLLARLSTAAAPTAVPSTEASSEPQTDDSSEEPFDETPTVADQQAAAEAVQRYNDAWMIGDCDAYMETTSEEFRGLMEITSCETFAVESRSFAASLDDYVTTIVDVETVGSALAVSTSESYTSLYDDDGNQTDEPMGYEDRYEYIVVNANGAWVIDDFFAE